MFGGLHPDGMTPLEKQEHFAKWGQYLGYFNQHDQLISGSPLSKAGKVMTQNGAFDLLDYNQLEGYMILEAESYQAVEQLLEECPSLDFQSNKIEIRELTPNF